MDISSRKDCKLFKIKESRMNFIKSSLSLHVVLMPLLQTLIFKVCNKDTRTTLMTSIVCVFINNFEKCGFLILQVLKVKISKLKD